MVIPWVGLSARRRHQAGRAAAGVRSTSSSRRSSIRRACPDRSVPVLRWPYVEGLRMDEAMHPLTILAVGLYGEVLPNQNGAPIRLVVPWKYGFKGIKSIVRIRFAGEQPRNTWQIDSAQRIRLLRQRESRRSTIRAGARRTERRLGEFRRRKTLMFNGYGEQVARLYAGMDLRKEF